MASSRRESGRPDSARARKSSPSNTPPTTKPRQNSPSNTPPTAKPRQNSPGNTPPTAKPRQNSPSNTPPTTKPRQNSPSNTPPTTKPRQNSPSKPKNAKIQPFLPSRAKNVTLFNPLRTAGRISSRSDNSQRAFRMLAWTGIHFQRIRTIACYPQANSRLVVIHRLTQRA